MTKALGIIPARWSSTRFRGKPLHLIAGKPLLQHVWERCRRAKSLDALIIATDDMRIAEAAFEWGAEVALTSAKHHSGTDRVAEVAAKTKQYELIVNIQGDEPLIEPHLVDRMVAKLRSHRKIDIVTAGHPFARKRDISSPHQVKVVIDRSGRAVDFSRETPSRSGGFQTAGSGKRRLASRRSLNLRLLRHQGIYAFRRAALLHFVKLKQSPRERAERLEQLRALENGVTVHVLVTKHGWPGVDTPQDAKNIAASLRQASSRRAQPLRRRRVSR